MMQNELACYSKETHLFSCTKSANVQISTDDFNFVRTESKIGVKTLVKSIYI